jgi:hypothetical protein
MSSCVVVFLSLCYVQCVAGVVSQFLKLDLMLEDLLNQKQCQTDSSLMTDFVKENC